MSNNREFRKILTNNVSKYLTVPNSSGVDISKMKFRVTYLQNPFRIEYEEVTRFDFTYDDIDSKNIIVARKRPTAQLLLIPSHIVNKMDAMELAGYWKFGMEQNYHPENDSYRAVFSFELVSTKEFLEAQYEKEKKVAKSRGFEEPEYKSLSGEEREKAHIDLMIKSVESDHNILDLEENIHSTIRKKKVELEGLSETEREDAWFKMLIDSLKLIRLKTDYNIVLLPEKENK